MEKYMYLRGPIYSAPEASIRPIQPFSARTKPRILSLSKFYSPASVSGNFSTILKIDGLAKLFGSMRHILFVK